MSAMVRREVIKLEGETLVTVTLESIVKEGKYIVTTDYHGNFPSPIIIEAEDLVSGLVLYMRCLLENVKAIVKPEYTIEIVEK